MNRLRVKGFTLFITALMLAGCAKTGPGKGDAQGQASPPTATAAPAGSVPAGPTAAGLPPGKGSAPPIWAANSWQVSTALAAMPDNAGGPVALTAAPDGTLYYQAGRKIFRIAPGGQPTLFAQGFDAFLAPGMVADGQGHLYLASGTQILRFDADGQSSVWAGSGENAFVDGLMTAASFNQITSLCGDTQGNLYAGEWGGRIRKVSPDGSVTTLVGLTPLQRDTLFSLTGGDIKYGFMEGGPGYLSGFDNPTGPCTVDGQGNLYFVNHGIRRVTPDGAVHWVAGNWAYSGYADGLAAEAQFRSITALAADSQGNLWIADAGNQRIRRLTPDGHVYTVAGSGFAGRADKWNNVGTYEGAIQDGPGPTARFNHPDGLTIVDGKLYVADGATRDLRVITGSKDPYGPGQIAVPIVGPDLVPARGPVNQVEPAPATVAFALYAPVTAARFQVDGGPAVQGDEPLYTAGWDAAGLAPGPHTVVASGRLPDGTWVAGDSATVQVGPVALAEDAVRLVGIHYTLLTLWGGAMVRGRLKLLLVGDGINLELRLDGQTLAKGNGRLLSATWDTTAGPDGDHILEVGHYVPEHGAMYYDQIPLRVRNGPLPDPAGSPGPGLQVFLGGKPYTYTTGTPRLVDGTPMLPCLETMQALGFPAVWDRKTNLITASNRQGREDTLDVATGKVTFTDSRFAPGSFMLQPQPIVEDGVVYVPLLFLADAMGVNSAYIPESKLVRLPY